ncbi:cysteine-rich motor neuron 1 protein [Biomphalaria pfeifferi]|uniref:Cysteine-rich motor neuron 1 protein n=1 Tax=Biomphalaria pfeifferi TaxID=112525 RepID=A0AAD8BFT6_BIOPF|nr:cysteine-rich motor neuron 1 protein [Biomphalaria pfeifferi]
MKIVLIISCLIILSFAYTMAQNTGCVSGGVTYQDGDNFAEGCNYCECDKGNVICYPGPCGLIYCGKNIRPVQKEGECCLSCPDE